MFQWLKNAHHSETELSAEALSRDLFASLLTLAWVVEAKDPYTGGHLWRVSRYANLLAKKGGLPDADVARITLGGFLHDLGKISVPDAVLSKRGKLSEKEFAEIKTHPEAGSRMLAGHPLGHLVAPSIEFHHERPDGRGYPHKLTGSMIPVDAAIVGIGDAFDAMTSERPYSKAMPGEGAIHIIADNLDMQFNRFWGEHFVELHETGAFTEIIGHSDSGIPLHRCSKCGPTVVQNSQQQAGEHVYCRACRSEFELCEHHGTWSVKSTGNKGSAGSIRTQTDHHLIKRVIEESLAALPVSQMLHVKVSA